MSVKVSIVITCYNLGAFVHEALESALGQTFPDLEVVLVDDGSTDAATINTLDELPPHPRLRVLRTANQGVARARNYGIRQTSGTYILPLDADDRILPSYVERAVAILDSDPGIGFVGCHYRIFGDRQGECRPEAYAIPELLVENVVPIASVFRRSCWEEVGGYCPDLNSIEDWDLWIGTLERGYRGEVIPEILFEYRVRPNSNLSHIRDADLYQQRMKLLYGRHKALYDRHTDDVLLGKDRQFANLLEYVAWLEQQARNWERLANERQDLLAMLGASAQRTMNRRAWWRAQIERVQQVVSNEPTIPRAFLAVTQGAWRVARRKLSSRYQA